MNTNDPDFNKDRNRYYGVRVGDIVGSSVYRFGSMLLGKVVEYGFMDNNKVLVRILGTEETMECVAEWLTVLLEVGTPPDKAEIANIPVPPQLITEQFLLSKGWEKSKSDFILDQWTLEIDFEEPEMLLRWGDYDNHPSYEGAIPTESQYEVLNQLLKLHP